MRAPQRFKYADMLVQDTTFLESWHNQLRILTLSENENTLDEIVQLIANGECISENRKIHIQEFLLTYMLSALALKIIILYHILYRESRREREKERHEIYCATRSYLAGEDAFCVCFVCCYEKRFVVGCCKGKGL
jgi:hypothetical protein